MIICPVRLIHHTEERECGFGSIGMEAGVEPLSFSIGDINVGLRVCEESVVGEYETAGKR